MRKIVLILAMATTLILTGCGRKEPPQVVVGNGSPPAVINLQHVVSGNSLKLTFSLTGGEVGIGYQVDRAEIDPHCNCPSFWRRFSEITPTPKAYGIELSKLINLRGSDREFAFRIRAVDAYGRLGQWSGTIRARSQIEE